MLQLMLDTRQRLWLEGGRATYQGHDVRFAVGDRGVWVEFDDDAPGRLVQLADLDNVVWNLPNTSTSILALTAVVMPLA